MVYIKVTLPNGKEKVAEVEQETTLREILLFVECPVTNITVFNAGDTPMPYLDWTMVQYNNWYIEQNYIPSLYVKFNTMSG